MPPRTQMKLMPTATPSSTPGSRWKWFGGWSGERPWSGGRSRRRDHWWKTQTLMSLPLPPHPALTHGHSQGPGVYYFFFGFFTLFGLFLTPFTSFAFHWKICWFYSTIPLFWLHSLCSVFLDLPFLFMVRSFVWIRFHRSFIPLHVQTRPSSPSRSFSWPRA